MEKFMNFKRMEVTGATKEEALANAPFGIQGDATQAYRNARKTHTGAWTDADMKQFMLDYLAKKSKNLPGVGFSITVESAVADTREKPYTIEDVKNKDGQRETAKVFQFIEDATGTVVAETPVSKTTRKDKEGNEILDKETNKPKLYWKSATKAEAKELGRKLYENGYKGNLTVIPVKKVVKGEEIAFRMKYTPSKNSRPGVYLVFGIENA